MRSGLATGSGRAGVDGHLARHELPVGPAARRLRPPTSGGVLIEPGHTELTRTPRFPYSTASVFVTRGTAPFDAA